MQHSAYIIQYAAYSMQYAANIIQHSAYRILNTAFSIQYAAYRIHNAALSMPVIGCRAAAGASAPSAAPAPVCPRSPPRSAQQLCASGRPLCCPRLHPPPHPRPHLHPHPRVYPPHPLCPGSCQPQTSDAWDCEGPGWGLPLPLHQPLLLRPPLRPQCPGPP
ncbi:hypothetical protein B484DRAFT_448996, partial [Ochromonadaceae sp. CCMP2298]